MSNLLQVSRLRPKGKTPLLMEMQVSPDTAPYLVSSTKSVAWILEPMEPTPELWAGGLPEHVVRVAVRPDLNIPGFFVEVVDAVAEAGAEFQWGNRHPLTEEGIREAAKHVEYYDQGDLCLLIPREEALPFKELAGDLGYLPQTCSWLPPDCVVVIPKDRQFVGLVGLLGRSGSVALVHNPSRAIGIAKGIPE